MPQKIEERNDVVDVQEASVSLSQAILAPLDALFKAQIHSARSFLNFLLQIGFQHQDANAQSNTEGQGGAKDKTETFELKFKHTLKDPGSDEMKEYEISIPALALVPVNALSIDSGEFKFGLSVKKVADMQQMQESRGGDTKRPWNLVSNPLSMVGTISSNTSSRDVQQSEATIDIHIKVSKSPVPAALDNLLTTLSQSSKVTEIKTS